MERKRVEQEYSTQEGFDIVSSLICYNNGQDIITCGEAFYPMHHALLSSIEFHSTNYELIFNYLRLFISKMCCQTFTSGFAQMPNGECIINVCGPNNGMTLREVIERFKKTYKMMRNDYAQIQTLEKSNTNTIEL